MNRKYKIWAIDFDGTIVQNKWPAIGELEPRAVALIRAIKRSHDKWILYTMREGDSLQQALDFLKAHKLTPDAVNDNLPAMQKAFKNNPRKIYADYYVDDHNVQEVVFTVTTKGEVATPKMFVWYALEELHRVLKAQIEE